MELRFLPFSFIRKNKICTTHFCNYFAADGMIRDLQWQQNKKVLPGRRRPLTVNGTHQGTFHGDRRKGFLNVGDQDDERGGP